MPPTIAPDPRREPARRQAQPLAPGATKKRMLIIVNPYATTVSDRLKNLVVYALQARYEVEAVDTEASEHAIEIGREAPATASYDIVVAFGGDGTLNEVANGLAGTDVPVSVLPGGSTNVVCRTLGIPNDVVDATEHLIAIADDFQAPQDRPRPHQRPPLRLRLRHGPRRHRRQAGRRPPAHEGPGRPVVLHLGGDLGLLPRLPARPGPHRGRARGQPLRGRHHDPPELRPLHLLRRPPGPGLRRARRSTTARSRSPCCAARPSATCRRSPGRVLGESERSRPAKHRQIDHAEGVTEALVRRSRPTRAAPSAASRSRWTATTSAISPSSRWASSRGP